MLTTLYTLFYCTCISLVVYVWYDTLLDILLGYKSIYRVCLCSENQKPVSFGQHCWTLEQKISALAIGLNSRIFQFSFRLRQRERRRKRKIDAAPTRDSIPENLDDFLFEFYLANKNICPNEQPTIPHAGQQCRRENECKTTHKAFLSFDKLTTFMLVLTRKTCLISSLSHNAVAL